MTRPVALLTDFGYVDAYAGVMKGVILSRSRDTPLFDLTHGIPRQDVLAGALQLVAAVQFCPPETVFLAVVDPGVGSERRPLCARSAGRLFVGPDNGLLWPAASALGEPEFFHLDRPRYWLPEVGSTFHGRDVFAPIAGMLSLGRAPEDMGSPISDPATLEIPRAVDEPGGMRGEVLLVDGYGNAVTNFRPEDMSHPPRDAVTFTVAGRTLTGPSSHYGAVAEGKPVVVLGSLGYYEIAVNGGSAAESLGLTRGTPLAATWTRIL